jgi:hypothetical protein
MHQTVKSVKFVYCSSFIHSCSSFVCCGPAMTAHGSLNPISKKSNFLNLNLVGLLGLAGVFLSFSGLHVPG